MDSINHLSQVTEAADVAARPPGEADKHIPDHRLKRMWVAGSITIILWYLALGLWANSDLVAGRFALHVDERITFDGVRKILHPGSIEDFFHSITDGGDHRYGRSLWNSLSIGAAIPAYMFGDTGQIIAARMTQVVLLSVSFLILTWTFVQSWTLRCCTLLGLYAMPYTSYYMTMPKPEPIQMLFVAIFFYWHRKEQHLFGPHWIWLGLAFGSKVSALPIVIILVVEALAGQRCRQILQNRFWKAEVALTGFVLGVVMAVPILAVPAVVGMGGYFTSRLWLSWIHDRYGLGSLGYALGQCFSLGVALYSAITSTHVVESWARGLFANAIHGSDQASITFFSWLTYYVDVWLLMPTWLSITLLLGCACLVAMHIGRGFRLAGGYEKIATEGVILLLCGLAMNGSIMLTTHRLWGFYLFPGTVLLLVGIASLVDEGLRISLDVSPLIGKRIENLLTRVVLCGAVLMITVYWFPQSLKDYQTQAMRTHAQTYVDQLRSYQEVVKVLSEISPPVGSKIQVAFDPLMFPPANTETYEIKEFYGAFKNWSLHYDIVIFSAIHTLQGASYPDDARILHELQLSRKEYARYVAGSSGSCVAPRCYERKAVLPNGGEILVLLQG